MPAAVGRLLHIVFVLKSSVVAIATQPCDLRDSSEHCVSSSGTGDRSTMLQKASVQASVVSVITENDPPAKAEADYHDSKHGAENGLAAKVSLSSAHTDIAAVMSLHKSQDIAPCQTGTADVVGKRLGKQSPLLPGYEWVLSFAVDHTYKVDEMYQGFINRRDFQFGKYTACGNKLTLTAEGGLPDGLFSSVWTLPSFTLAVGDKLSILPVGPVGDSFTIASLCEIGGSCDAGAACKDESRNCLYVTSCGQPSYARYCKRSCSKCADGGACNAHVCAYWPKAHGKCSNILCSGCPDCR